MINTGPIPYQQSSKFGAADEELTIAQLAGTYEKLVDVVCAGAKFGPSAGLESRYISLRDWMLPRVAQVASVLSRHQTSNPDKIALLLERLLVSESLDALLQADDGSLIQRMSWISQALFDAGMDD